MPFLSRTFQHFSKHDWIADELRIAKAMEQHGALLNRELAYRLLEKCRERQDLKSGRLVQSLMSQNGLDSIAVLVNHLIRLFASCASLIDANQAYSRSVNTDIFTWNAAIAAHAKLGKHDIAFKLYERLQTVGVSPDKFTLLGILKACIGSSFIELGKCIHHLILENELLFDVVIGSTLVDMYAKCQKLEEARRVFDMLPNRNVVSWNAMVTGYAQHGECFFALQCFEDMECHGIKPDVVTWGAMIEGYAELGKGLYALEWFERMQTHGIEPNNVIFMSVLKACGSTGSLERAKLIHEKVIEDNLQLDVVIGNVLVDIYVKCQDLEGARRLFDMLPNQDLVSWSAMIGGYAHYGDGLLALECFKGMERYSIKPDKVALLSILKACSCIGGITFGKCIHERVITCGLQSDIVVGSTLVDMYAKSGDLMEACRVFNELPDQDVVLWNVLVTGFVQHGEGLLALECLRSMQHKGIRPDKATFVGASKACGSIGAIEEGKHIHEQILENTMQTDAVVGSTLVDMYANCGYLEEASRVFNRLASRTAVSWGVMVAGYAQHGEAVSAMQSFESMICCGFEPDAITFTGILAVCSHAGHIDEGCWYFNIMRECYDIKPDIVHVTCVVDLLGRAGHFKEARSLLHSTGDPNVSGWMALLSACRLHSNLELGKVCFDEIVHLDSTCGAAYVLMSIIYCTVLRQGPAEIPIHFYQHVKQSNKNLQLHESVQNCVCNSVSHAKVNSW